MSQTTTTEPSRLSHKEYFKLEESRDQRFEYIAGDIFAMTGGTEAHALISSNALIEFGVRLKERRCRVYGSDMKLYISEHDKFCYPDIMVLCETGKRHSLYIEQPMVIIEVLSETTESYDRGLKFEHYRSIETLRYYLLLNQNRPLAEIYHREESEVWKFREVSGLQSEVEFPEFDMTIGMDDIYRNVDFSKGQETRSAIGYAEQKKDQNSGFD